MTWSADFEFSRRIRNALFAACHPLGAPGKGCSSRILGLQQRPFLHLPVFQRNGPVPEIHRSTDNLGDGHGLGGRMNDKASYV